MAKSIYQIEVDRVDRNSWDQVITQFDDASIYQTWAWGAVRSVVSHIVIRTGEVLLGCCQVEIRVLPLVGLGVADIIWGPLFMSREHLFESDTLVQLVHAIKQEYAINRGYMLRIWPHARGEIKQKLKAILETQGFVRDSSERPYRTLFLDLSPPLESLRQNLLQKWRNCLNKAERAELGVVEGTNDELFQVLIGLTKEMCERKNLDTGVDYQEFQRIQGSLPEPLKMRIMVCEASGEPVCAAACSVIGDTGIYLLGATGQKGLSLNGSYLLQWHMIQWMKEKRVRYYDLGAFNPQLNPGVYHFKLGIAGKKAWEETFLGMFQGCFNLSSRIAKILVECSRLLRVISRKRKRA